MTTFSVVEAPGHRVAIHFSTDDQQTTHFVDLLEFLQLMKRMLDFRDNHVEELRSLIEGKQVT